MKKSGLAVMLVCVLSMHVFAQNATLGGTVADASGALIPGVSVTATNTQTGIVSTTITNETGAYQFPNLRRASTKSAPSSQVFRHRHPRLNF